MGESDYGLHVWPCGIVLASYIAGNRSEFDGKKILEVGSGTGFVGIIAKKLCPDISITISDRSDDDRLLRLIERNCLTNDSTPIRPGTSSTDLNFAPSLSKDHKIDQGGGNIDIIGLTWGRFEPIIDRLRGRFDVILASDCFYDPSVFEDVIVHLRMLLRLNPTAKVYFTYQNRSSDWSSEWLLEEYGLICDRLEFTCDEYPSVLIGVIRMKER